MFKHPVFKYIDLQIIYYKISDFHPPELSRPTIYNRLKTFIYIVLEAEVLICLCICFTDLTGAQDGSVRLWEWGHQQCITVARQPGSFPKVSKVLFNAQGNKVKTSCHHCCEAVVIRTVGNGEMFQIVSFFKSHSMYSEVLFFLSVD